MRVLVTRPRHQGETTARRLLAAGHDAVFAPVLEVVPTGKPAPAGRYDAILITSQNAVPALAGDRGRFAATPIFAVGRRTADSLRAAGHEAVTEAAGDSLALVDLVSRALPPGARLLHAAGRDRKAEPARSLSGAGFQFVTWECYRAEEAVALPTEVAAALRLGSVHAVLHFSRRSAEVFAALARQAGLGEGLSGTSHLCLSADVAEGLKALPAFRLLIAARPDEAALLDLLGTLGARPGSQPPQSGC